MNEEVIEFLFEHHISAMVSLDGPQTVFDRYRKDRNQKSVYSKVLSNISAALARGCHIELRSTITHPLPDIAETVHFLEELDCDSLKRIAVMPCENSLEFCKSSADLTEDDLTKLADQEFQILAENDPGSDKLSF